MNRQNNAKSRLISKQKPRKRRKGKSRNRDSIDLINLHPGVLGSIKRSKTSRPKWVVAALLFISIPGFFLLGCWIAALTVSPWVKALIAMPIAVMGFVLSYIVVGRPQQ